MSQTADAIDLAARRFHIDEAARRMEQDIWVLVRAIQSGQTAVVLKFRRPCA